MQYLQNDDLTSHMKPVKHVTVRLTFTGFILEPSPFRALSESLITPLELKMEEWKKVASQLDKDHAKGLPPC